MSVTPTKPRVMTPDNVTSFAGLKIKSVREAVNNGLFMSFYSQGGVGKTTLAGMLTLSKHIKRGLLLDSEAGASVVAHLDDKLDFAPYEKWSSFTNLRSAVEKTPLESLVWNLFIIDNLTDMMHQRFQELLASSDTKDPRQLWNILTMEFLKELRAWRELTVKKGVHVIFNLWEDRAQDPENEAWIRRVLFNPALAKAFPGVVTMVGHVVSVRNFPDYRLLSFQANPNTDAKFRVAPTENAATIPQQIYYKADQPVLADFLGTVMGDHKWPTSKYQKPTRQANQQ